MAVTSLSILEVGPGEWEVVLVESNAGPNDEVPLPNLPVKGTVRRQTCVIVSGPATSVRPQLTKTTGGSDYVVRASEDSAGTEVDIAGTATYHDDLSTDPGTLYHKSVVNMMGANEVRTEYNITVGW